MQSGNVALRQTTKTEETGGNFMGRISPLSIFVIILLVALVALNPSKDDFFDELGDYVEDCSDASQGEAEMIRFLMSVGRLTGGVRRRNYIIASVFEAGDFQSIGMLGMLLHVQTDPEFAVLRTVIRNCDP
jgi:hypothetical protein